MEYFHFKKVNDLRAFLAKRHEDINLNASISQPSFYFVTTDKVVHRATGTKMLAQVLNDLLGNYYSVEDSVTVTRQRGTLAYALQEKQEKVETPVQEEKEEEEVITEPEVEEVVEDSPSLISLDVEEDVVAEGSKEPDWAWIESLENTKDDKNEFDKYCESEFSVKLSRTMKLSNMIKKFKEELAKR
ncbi:hypothetical protein NVP1187O_146 [Vibrio phage 1.187.O._10N.286.49.F1]|nr:hypothetical protein NVP1187O_146 [Vibrio phage 1.187.O._10N.286.49.F1]